MRLETRTPILFTLMAAVFMAGAVPLVTADSASALDCEPSDFVTGGGFIVFPNGAHGNFGVAGGCKNGAFWGHLEYVDHGSGLAPASAPTPFRVHGTEVIGYVSFDATTREFAGRAETNDPNHPTVTYCVRVTDNGEGQSGTGDFFGIELSNDSLFYFAFDTLVSGNIQPQKGNQPPNGVCFIPPP